MASKKELTKPVVVLLVFIVSVCHCQQNRFYIRSPEKRECPVVTTASHCKDLSTFVAERNYSTSMVLEFLPGHHYLRANLEITGTKRFIMSSHHEEGELSVTIVSNYKSFIFKNVSVVKINSILFHSCGEYFGAVQLQSVNRCEIINSQWEKSTRSSAVFINDSNALISDCQFSSSACSDCPGGGIRAEFSNVTITGSNQIYDNVVEESGGGLYLIKSKLHLDGNLTIAHNWGLSGGGMYIVDSIFTATQISFLLTESNGCTGSDGGGLYFERVMAFIAGHTVFAHNSATENGGGVYILNSQCKITGNITFLNNSAGITSAKTHIQGKGGGMYIEGETVMLNTISFSDNSASRGGGLYLTESNFTVSKNATFYQNFARHGGALNSRSTFITMLSVTVFQNNTADTGGAITMVGGVASFEGFTSFIGNMATSGGAILSSSTNFVFEKELRVIENTALFYGGGFFIHGGSLLCYEKVTFTRNKAHKSGGGMHCTKSRCTFSEAAVFLDNKAYESGGGMYCKESSCTFSEAAVFLDNKAYESGGGMYCKESSCTFSEAAVFLDNRARYYGGSINLVQESNFTFLSTVMIFSSHAGWAGGGISVSYSVLELNNVSRIENCNASSYGGAIALDHSKLTIRGSCKVADNKADYGGGIHAIGSNLVIVSNVSFERNIGQFGGGCSLSDSSLIHCSLSQEYTNTIQYDSNFASQYGGGIWIEDIPFYSCVSKEQMPIRLCFLQMSFHKKCMLKFLNNRAQLAGSNLYGGSVDNCVYTSRSKHKLNITDIYTSVNESINSSPISSDPMHVCLCTVDNEPDCSILNYSTEVFSGQEFPLTLVGVGQMNGTVPAVIRSKTDTQRYETIQTANKTCSKLKYTVTSDKQFVKLYIYPDRPCHNISSYSSMITVSVKIKPCPPGFKLHNETESCTCDDTLKKLDIQCHINSQSFAHGNGVWIGYSHYNRMIIYHPHCPFDYCLKQWSSFTINSTDNQCRYNRIGHLCGACEEGYSLTLGGSKCAQCSHVYILLFFPLAAAGVVLVFFLLTFRLTVAMGTINGLIFFANIIGTNSSIFLPSESTAVLRVLIAWLNLDLGISICLFDGLDMYTKVWLQFIFPFYVFFLAGVIVAISRYSTLFTRCLGSDPVAVLATLILLAYTKLFRTILTIMSFTFIQSSDGSRITVWLYDGNVRFLSGRHIGLLIFALMILIFLIVPYTMILLFAPCLLHYSQNRFLFWIDDRRLKPFLFSYYAPLKNKFRSWISILLVLRLCLMILFISNVFRDPSINLLAIAIAVVIITCMRVLLGTIYKNWWLDALELFFIMNLGLFSISTLFVISSSGNQRALANTIVSIVFIVFVAITVYHGWRQLTDSRWWRYTLKPKWQKRINSKYEGNQRAQEESEEQQIRPSVPTTFIDLRESLLDST